MEPDLSPSDPFLHHDSHNVDDEPQEQSTAPTVPRAEDQDRVGDKSEGAAHHHDPLQGDGIRGMS